MDMLYELFEEIFAVHDTDSVSTGCSSVTKLNKIIFSDKRKKSLEFSRVLIRPVEIGGNLMFQAEYTYPKKVTHANLDTARALELASKLVEESFKQINIFTDNEGIQVLASKADKPRIKRKASSCAGGCTTLSHNKTKNYVIPDGKPCDFLIELGVMSKEGKVFPKHYAKFRQINRYLEIVEDVFEFLPAEKTLRIIDFGCGKAYLTFALYHYLKIIKNRNVEIIGLDLKKDVIEFCSRTARKLNYTGLQFLMGDIADYTNDHADMVVTLHACDTATDYALINAVAWNTRVILSVPCCQHELFSQIKNELHQPMLKHGILKDRLTEYLTDGLRALKLESKGYETALIEFTSLEHTARNIMIKAVKTNSSPQKMQKAQAQYEALRDFYNVKPTIEKL